MNVQVSQQVSKMFYYWSINSFNSLQLVHNWYIFLLKNTGNFFRNKTNLFVWFNMLQIYPNILNRGALCWSSALEYDAFCMDLLSAFLQHRIMVTHPAEQHFRPAGKSAIYSLYIYFSNFPSGIFVHIFGIR